MNYLNKEELEIIIENPKFLENLIKINEPIIKNHLDEKKSLFDIEYIRKCEIIKFIVILHQ